MNGGELDSKMALVSKMCWFTDYQALTPECVHTPFLPLQTLWSGCSLLKTITRRQLLIYSENLFCVEIKAFHVLLLETTDFLIQQ